MLIRKSETGAIKMENYDRDQRALSKSNKRDIEEIKADEELLAEIIGTLSVFALIKTASRRPS